MRARTQRVKHQVASGIKPTGQSARRHCALVGQGTDCGRRQGAVLAGPPRRNVMIAKPTSHEPTSWPRAPVSRLPGHHCGVAPPLPALPSVDDHSQGPHGRGGWSDHRDRRRPDPRRPNGGGLPATGATTCGLLISMYARYPDRMKHWTWRSIIDITAVLVLLVAVVVGSFWWAGPEHSSWTLPVTTLTILSGTLPFTIARIVRDALGANHAASTRPTNVTTVQVASHEPATIGRQREGCAALTRTVHRQKAPRRAETLAGRRRCFGAAPKSWSCAGLGLSSIDSGNNSGMRGSYQANGAGLAVGRL